MTAQSLKDWRKRLGLSQTKAAEELGCGRRSLQQWESGANQIPKYIALACAAVSRGIKPQA